jgi:uncharacterized membrane protein YukC
MPIGFQHVKKSISTRQFVVICSGLLAVMLIIGYLSYSAISKLQLDQDTLQSKYNDLAAQHSDLQSNYSELQAKTSKI